MEENNRLNRERRNTILRGESLEFVPYFLHRRKLCLGFLSRKGGGEGAAKSAGKGIAYVN